MPILNMVGGGKKGGNIGEPLNLTATVSGTDATITWEDNEIGTIPPTSFQKSELVRKVGSAPTSPSDGTLLVTETVKDTYKTSGYVDQGLTNGTTYYYRVFSYSDLGGISYCDAVSVTARWQPGANTLAWFPLVDDTTDHVGTATITGGTQTKASLGYTFSCATTGSSTTVNGGNFWSAWVKFNSRNNYYISFLSSGAGLYFKHYESRLDNKFYIFTNSSFAADTSNNTGITTGTWYYICFGNDNGTRKFYINGSNFWNSTATKYFGSDGLGIFSSTDVNRTDTADISDIIVESVCRTAQEISDYYNSTKSIYGL